VSEGPQSARTAAAGAGPAGRGLAGKLWFWLPWPILVALDLWTKVVVFGFLLAEQGGLDETARAYRVFGGGLLCLDLVAWRNTGTIWGLLQDGTIVLMVLRCLAVVGLFWYVRRTARRARLQQLVMSLILAGAIGNLYDNFFCPGRGVRDFLYFTGGWPWAWTFPAFNVADSCITVGAIVLFVLLWREDRAAARKPVD
jgi:lipoprotein signal peptidase